MTSEGALPALRREQSSLWPSVVRAGVSALLLIYVFRNFNWGELWIQLRSARPVWLLAGWCFFGLPLVLMSIRWRLLLRVQGLRIRLGRLLAITCIGQFFNMFLLGATGGDAVKIFYITREAPNAKAGAAMSIVVDRLIGFVVLSMVALVAAAADWNRFMSSSDLRRVVWMLGAIVAAAVIGSLALILIPLPRICRWLRLPARVGRVVEDLQDAARQYIRAPGLTAAAAALTIPVHMSSITGGYFTAKALGLPMGYAAMGVILAIVFFVISIPITISGHGLRESIFVLMFSLFGIAAPAALAYSLCYFGFMLAWSLACGPVYWAYQAGDSVRSIA